MNSQPEFPAVAAEDSPEYMLLVQQLFMRLPETRLGSAGHQELLQHEFFKNFKWDTLSTKVLLPLAPYMNAVAEDKVASFVTDGNLFPKSQIMYSDLASAYKNLSASSSS